MKFIVIVTCLVIPLLASSIEKALITEKEQIATIKEAPIGTTEQTTKYINVSYYRGPKQNLKPNIRKGAALKNYFYGISYEILTTTDDKGIREFLTLDYVQAVKACNNRSLLTFKTKKENAFVSNWLFNELKIETQVWIGLTRVNGTNDFVWADGTKLKSKNDEKLFKNWHKCEPNDITTTKWKMYGWGEDCVEMYSSYYPYPRGCDVNAKAGQWNDIPCRQIYNMVVCQEKSS
ncbi:hypothetical protein HA402_015162 [Bradysia odoriphaga]|nr:hypothetical protein HA402_015162 [Bradysia odoriphaga]